MSKKEQGNDILDEPSKSNIGQEDDVINQLADKLRNLRGIISEIKLDINEGAGSTSSEPEGPAPDSSFPSRQSRPNFNPVFTVSPEMKNALPCISPRTIFTRSSRPSSSRGYSDVEEPAPSGPLSAGDAPQQRLARRARWGPPRIPIVLHGEAVEQNAEEEFVEQNPEEEFIEQNPEEEFIEQNPEEEFIEQNPEEEFIEQNPEEEFIEQNPEEFVEQNLEEEFVEQNPEEEFVEQNSEEGSVESIAEEETDEVNTDEGTVEDNPDEIYIENNSVEGFAEDNSEEGSNEFILEEECVDHNPFEDERATGSNLDERSDGWIYETVFTPAPSCSATPDCPTEADNTPQVKPPRAKWGPPSIPPLLKAMTPRFTPRLIWQTLEEEDGEEYEADILEDGSSGQKINQIADEQDSVDLDESDNEDIEIEREESETDSTDTYYIDSSSNTSDEYDIDYL